MWKFISIAGTVASLAFVGIMSVVGHSIAGYAGQVVGLLGSFGLLVVAAFICVKVVSASNRNKTAA